VGERVLEELAFPVARRTSERDAVELGDDRKRLATFAKRAGESAIGILDAAVENLAGQEVELDRETARRRGPAAAARARTAEELERARRDRSVEHIDRARPGGHPGKGLAHARHGADRVEERFGLEGTRREAGEEARLERSERASDFRARRRRRKRAPRERARESDASNERAQPKAIADEVACEGIEKRGMACGIRRPEIIDGLDEAATEKLGPDAVHHRAREKEMVGRDEPIGEGDARIVV